LHEDDRDIVQTEVARAINQKSSYSIEFRFHHGDGSIRWMEERGEAFYSEKGEPVRLYGIGIDITERKKAEEVIAKTAAIVESSDDAIISKDLNGIITSWNSGAERLFGYTAQEALGLPIIILIPPDRLDEEPKILERLRRGESVDHFETVRMRKDGSKLDISLTISPVRDAHGRVVGASKIARDITERKRAGEALVESERRLREVIDSLPVAVYTTDAEGNITHYNEAAAEFAGRRATLGKDKWCVTWRLYQPDGTFLPHDKCPMADALLTGKPVRGVEAVAERPDGTRAHFMPFPTPLFDHDGKLTGGINVLVDITERKQAERILKASEAQLQTLFDEVPLGVYVIDADFRISAVNPIALPVFGDISDLIGRDFDAVIHRLWSKEYADEVATLFRHTLETGEPYFAPERIEEKRDLGITEYYEWRINRIQLPDGRFGVVCYFRDISAQVFARQKIVESEQEYQALVLTSAQIVWTTNADGEVEEDSPTWREFTGQTYDEWKGFGWLDAIFPEDRLRTAKEWKKHVKSRTPIEIEYRVRSKDGDWRWMIARAAPIIATDGSLRKWVGMNTDITERRLLEERIARHNEILRAVATDKPLGEILRLATESVEKQLPGSLASVLLADREETHLYCGSAENLPAEYNAAIDGITIGEGAGSCGTAAFRRKTVVVSDTATDPLWTNFHDLALSHNLRACWSQPILSPEGKLLGTFAVYFRFPRKPRIPERKILESAARVAGIAISRKQAEDDLRESREQLAEQLAAAQKLHEASTSLIREDNAEALYEQILDTAVAIMHSDFASIQMLHPERGEKGELELLGFRGFDPEAAKFWQWVNADSGCTCGQALLTRERAIASDVATCYFMAGTKDREVYLQAGILAAQTTPLISRSGVMLGMISTHWDKPHEPAEHELHNFDILARQATDLIERKQAEEKLRASQAETERQRRLYDAILSNTPDLAYVFDLNHRFTYANDILLKMWGKTLDEAIGKNYLELGYPQWHAEMHDREIDQVVATKQPIRGEVPFTGTFGRRIYDYIFVPVIGADGKVEAVAGTSRDITELKEEEDRLALIAGIADLMRTGAEPQELLFTVAKTIGRYLGASRCLFNEIDLDENRETVHRDYFNGVKSVAGVHRLTDYSPVTSAEMASGKTVVNYDSKTDKRTADNYERTYKPSGERAYVAVPLLRNGRWVASLWVSDDKPRTWTPKEINLLETVAERTWLAVEKLKSERSLRESEEQYRTLFNKVPVAVYTCDAEGVITTYNQNAITLWGREPEPGERFNGSYKLYDSEGRPLPHNKGPMARVLRGETLEDGEDEILVERPDGARKVVIAIPGQMRNEHGAIVGGINCLYDVTELKVAQRALIRSERRAANDYQALLQHIVPLGQKLGTARDLVTIYRAVHDFICSSMGCSAFFVSFYSPHTKLRTAAYAWGEGEEIDIGLLPPMPITPDGGSNSQAILGKKSVITNHYWDMMKDRPHVVLMENGIDPMSSLVVPMIIKDSVIGTLEVQAHEDHAFITEHVVAMEMVANLAAVAIENVRLLEAHDKARQEAEAANRTKDEFLSVLSHELRTPLNSMMGWIRMMRLGNLDAEHTAKAIEVIDRNTRVQSSLIEDLLDVSRIISGKMRVEKELTDITAAVKTAAEAIRPIAAAKSITFDVNTGGEPMFADGDPVRLQQVVTNLVQNAIKFTPERGRIEVAIKRVGTNAILEISDSGIGIEEDLVPLIFDRFRQGDASTKRGFSGLGLGLTIVRTIVELHGGGIKVESDGKDRGSRFTVTLPLSEVLYAEDVVTNGDKNQPPPELDGIKILLVDDDFDSIKPLQLFLEGQKAGVACAGSASEAWKKLTNQKFDILITDIGMPGKDGFDLVNELRHSEEGKTGKLPAIAVTAYVSPGDRERALAVGFQDHLAKPVNFDELLKAVKKLLHSTKAAPSAL